MAFLAYKKSPSADGSTRYERLAPVTLSGAGGVIARHVRSLSSGEAAKWSLSARDLLALAGRGDLDSTVLLFGAANDPGLLCEYEVVRIQGSCKEATTALAFDFQILVDRPLAPEEDPCAFALPAGGRPRPLGEVLALSGGPAGGDWKWDSAGLSLGATVVAAPRSCGCGKSGQEACSH